MLGVSAFMFCVAGAIVLVRYRALVPLMFSLLLIEQVARRLVSDFIPMIRVGATPGGTINIVLTSVMVVGLALALIPRQARPRTSAP